MQALVNSSLSSFSQELLKIQGPQADLSGQAIGDSCVLKAEFYITVARDILRVFTTLSCLRMIC